MTNFRLLIRSLVLLLALSTYANAQSISTTTCPGAGCVTYNVSGQGSIGIQITGTWVGTVTFQSSLGTTSSSTFTSLLVFPSNSQTGVTTTTGNGVWSTAIAGFNQVRVVFTVYTSGTAVVTYRSTSAAKNNPSAPGGSGTVTSVGLALPTAVFDISGSPVTTSGTLTATFDTQIANTIFSGPTIGADATPSFRALVAADLPSGTISGTIANTQVAYGTGTNVIAGEAGFTYDPATDIATLVGGLDLLSTGVRITATDGIITFLGRGNGNDEDFIIDLDNDSADHIWFRSSTGANPTIRIFGTIAVPSNTTITENRFSTTMVAIEQGAGDVNGLRMSSTHGIRWTANSLTWNSTPDLLLDRDAANILRQANSTNAQRFNLANTFTSASVREDLSFYFSSNVAHIATTQTGATARSLQIDFGGTTTAAFTIPITSGNIIVGGGLDILSTGVRASGADGVLTLLGLGDGADENLTLDFDNAGANVVAIASGTGVSVISWTGRFTVGDSFVVGTASSLGNDLSFANFGLILWSSTSGVSGSKDTGLFRNAAGVVEVNSGTGAAYREIKYRSAISGGTVPGISGCTAGTQVGGGSAGTFVSGTTGACTVVLTFAFTAPNGWVCHANDLSTPANLISQSARTTTTCTVTGTTVSGDVISFLAIAY